MVVIVIVVVVVVVACCKGYVFLLVIHAVDVGDTEKAFVLV